jgi:2-oxo-4-hydroxy-4-carboxy-5-ureidoimidazoline decarboxylase
LVDGEVEDVRLAMGSVASVPLRLTKTEQSVRGKVIDSQLLSLARRAAAAEVQPIDDIRSTAKYRAAVAGNLVVEFLNRLKAVGTLAEEDDAAAVLARWNRLPIEEAMRSILACCGSQAWAHGMATRRPMADVSALLAAADETWHILKPSDWMEAFDAHSRIGESRPSSSKPKFPPTQSVEWSAQEQRKVADADAAAKKALADANREYERRFGRIFIVCATGKSVLEILEILRRHLDNDAETELHEAAEQQRQITQIRLRKWLQK